VAYTHPPRVETEDAMRRYSKVGLGIVVAAALAIGSVGTALAADPPGSGQPSQSCQAEPMGPPGLVSTTNGFATMAVNVYAGSPGTPSAANGAPQAVSQYDVACFEVSQPH
jgi:hypothetical protein